MLAASAAQALDDAGGQQPRLARTSHTDAGCSPGSAACSSACASAGAIEHQWFAEAHPGGRQPVLRLGRPAARPRACRRSRIGPHRARVPAGRPGAVGQGAAARPGQPARRAGTRGGRPGRSASAGAEGGVLARLLLERLAPADVLTVTSNQGRRGGVRHPGERGRRRAGRRTTALLGGQHLLACHVCQGQVPGTATVVDQLDGAPCMVTRCPGRAAPRAGDRTTSTAASTRHTRCSGSSPASTPACSTTRPGCATRTSSRARPTDPDAPNVLVATPTLEMGIDIGDLSTVHARVAAHGASRPTCSGSAGPGGSPAARSTSPSSPAAASSCPQLGDPLSVINGQVRPPATYLSAEEILRRQYVASLVDSRRARADGVHPEGPPARSAAVDPGSYLHAHRHTCRDRRRAPRGIPRRVPDAHDLGRVSALRTWVTPDDGRATSPMAERLRAESQRWRQQVETLGSPDRRDREVAARAAARSPRLPVATDDDKHAYRSAEASLRLAKRQRADLQGEYWIGVLEEPGSCPTTRCSTTASRSTSGCPGSTRTPGATRPRRTRYQRNAALALREFAPGATFYAGGYQVRINAVDLGNKGEAVRSWAFCAACGYSADVTESAAPTSCPRCGSPAIADVSQRLDVVEMTTRVVDDAPRRGHDRRRARRPDPRALPADRDRRLHAGATSRASGTSRTTASAPST